MKRVFIAVRTEPGKEFIRMCSSLKAILANERISWVNMDNIHLTLVFLGDTEEERIRVAGIVLKQKCSRFGEFSFILSGAGVFRNFNDPKVIWAGIRNPEKLIELNALIVEGLKDTGFKSEVRQFNPHVTIGRIKLLKNAEALKSAIGRYSSTFFQEVKVQEIILFESVLKPTGPVYNAIGNFKLK